MEALIKEALESLEKNNSGFCSEAHFQHAIANELDKLKKFDKVILERLYSKSENNNSGIYLDIWLKLKDSNKRIGIELKFKTALDKFEIDENEIFESKAHGALDLGRYGFWKDVRRLEQLIRQDKINFGYVLFLTNESSYWEPKTKCTLDKHFDLSSKRPNINGPEELDWIVEEKRRKDGKHWTDKYPSINLAGKYGDLNWEIFNFERGIRFKDNFEFKYLLKTVTTAGFL